MIQSIKSEESEFLISRYKKRKKRVKKPKWQAWCNFGFRTHRKEELNLYTKNFIHGDVKWPVDYYGLFHHYGGNKYLKVP